MSSSSASISILPVGPDDYAPIAALESLAFDDDPITVCAYGPNRAIPEALQVRAHSLANPASYPLARLRKAVAPSGEIAGFALWKLYTDVERNPAAVGRGGSGGDVGGVETGAKEEKGERVGFKASSWPEGANVQLCEAVFGMSDELCRLAFQGRKYAVLNILAISPKYQGRGIGSMLIREGLGVVDEMGLPAWLGATEVALPLYQKVGFVVDREFEFDMKPYGGEGLTKHILMIRPAAAEKGEH